MQRLPQSGSQRSNLHITVKLLCLDISTKAGWAVLEKSESSPAALRASGLIEKTKANVLEWGGYPENYRKAARDISERLLVLVREHHPDTVVVEETNQGKNRYTQKLLEFIHKDLGDGWDRGTAGFEITDHRVIFPKIVYISTGTWKHALGLRKPKEAKQNDALLKEAKMLAAAGMKLNDAKKKLGIRGKWNKKMLAVNHVNQIYGLDWKLKDNDKAEAICLGLAFFAGAELCDGNPNPKKNAEE